MHCAKYTKQALPNLLAHYERRDNKKRNYNNKDIDKDRTCQNYNLAPKREEGLYKFIKNRVQELNILNRKNTIWCCDWCITVPKEIKDDEEKRKEFFKCTYDFLAERYGEKNVVSAFVHLDEASSSDFGGGHMHFCFIPSVTKQVCEFDNEKGELVTKTIEKVLCKEVINRVELSSIHTDLQRYLDNELDFEVHVLNGSTHGRNKSIKELKYKSELEKQIKENQQTLDDMKKAIKQLSTNFLNLHQNACHYNKVLVEEQKEREKELKNTALYVNNLMGSYDLTFDELLRQVENRDNRIYSIDLSYKKSLEILKELDNLNKESKELENVIEEKVKEYNKINDDELDLV